MFDDLERLDLSVGETWISASPAPHEIVIAWQDGYAVTPAPTPESRGRIRAERLDLVTGARTPLGELAPPGTAPASLSAGAAGPADDRRVLVAWTAAAGLGYAIVNAEGPIGGGEIALARSGWRPVVDGYYLGFVVVAQDFDEGWVRVRLDLDGAVRDRVIVSSDRSTANGVALATMPDGHHAIGWAVSEEDRWVVQRFDPSGAAVRPLEPIGAQANDRVALRLDGHDDLGLDVAYTSPARELAGIERAHGSHDTFPLDPSWGWRATPTWIDWRPIAGVVEETWQEDYPGCGPPPIVTSTARVANLGGLAEWSTVAQLPGPDGATLAMHPAPGGAIAVLVMHEGWLHVATAD